MTSTPNQGRSRQDSIRFNIPSVATTEVSNQPITATLSPTTSNTNDSPISKFSSGSPGQTNPNSTSIPSSPADPSIEGDKDLRHNLFGKVTGLLHKSLLSRDIMTSTEYESEKEEERNKEHQGTKEKSNKSDKEDKGDKGVRHKPSDSTLKLDLSQRPSLTSLNSNGSLLSPSARPYFRSVPLSRTDSPVKETNKIFIEYDPMTKRKVLNTYEILGEIGRGEHGKVKLAKDLVNKELVAIKIVNRKSKDRPQLRIRNSKPAVANEYELKIKREIAIMKKCIHKHIVQLKEVLDDTNTHKIYMVLEYLEKGEIKWKRIQSTDVNLEELPCCGTNKPGIKHDIKPDDAEIDLLSNEYAPNLSFKQSRKIFRDVILGLEYLHLQGIVHRDIKPANLLVSSDNTVKISDFGVSFASSLDEADEGLVNELELAKTAGTPAFFAPELCQTNFSSNSGSRKSSISKSRKSSKSGSLASLEALKNELTLTKVLPKIDYKIDIWALGVTLYCLLFGKLPFNADSEFDLFQVIVNQPLEFPEDKDSFNSPVPVSEAEFELAKDLLSKLLDKNSATRIEMKDIKEHPFVLMDLDDDLDALNELLYLNDPSNTTNFLSKVDLNNFANNDGNNITKDDIDNAIVGIGSRIKRSIVRAIASGVRDHDIRKKFGSSMEPGASYNSSSDESSSPFSSDRYGNADHSVILSESFYLNGSRDMSRVNSESHNQSQVHTPSNLSTTIVSGQGQGSGSLSRNSSYTLAGYKDGRFANPILNDVIESNSSASSRRGSASAGANEIETKRNVAGDLYLRNQSVVDTFRGIQEMDDKRRRSSAFSNPPTSKNSISSSNSVNVSSNTVPTLNGGISMFNDHDTPTQPVVIPGSNSRPLTADSDTSQIIVGPIDHNTDRRVSSVMSIPLTESFASLDSINDDYLNAKYQEYTKQKKVQKLQHEGSLSSIGEKFQTFNMSESMNSAPIKNPGISFNFAKRGHDLDEVAPKTIPDMPDSRRTSRTFSLSSSCSSSGSGSDSSTKSLGISIVPKSKSSTPRPGFNGNTQIKECAGSGDDSSDSGSESDSESSSDEDGNLTLAFSSRVAPARPKFLTLDQRAKSHDSSLTRLQRSKRPAVPLVILDNQDLEDVPAGLMSSVPRPSVSIAPMSTGDTTSSDPTPLEPLLLNEQSISQSSTDSTESTSTIKQTPANDQPSIRALKGNEPRRPSPLVNDAPFSDLATTNSHLVTPSPGGRKFNNHYKKDPISFPFPNAIHSDMDRETKGKTIERQIIGERPQYFRSNSITIGLLQHRDPKDEEN